MADKQPIRITERAIEHEDPEAAGFTSGFWWSVDTGTEEYGVIESGAATREEAVAFARLAAEAHGIPVDDLE